MPQYHSGRKPMADIVLAVSNRCQLSQKLGLTPLSATDAAWNIQPRTIRYTVFTIPWHVPSTVFAASWELFNSALEALRLCAIEIYYWHWHIHIDILRGSKSSLPSHGSWSPLHSTIFARSVRRTLSDSDTVAKWDTGTRHLSPTAARQRPPSWCYRVQ